MTKAEIKQKFDKIVDFAEIGEFIDSPVATYSSGMTVRLGFAIAIHCEPDILLLDEILAVGDSAFQGKCFNRIFELQKKGTGIILVSHNDQVIYDRCNCALLVDKGSLLHSGNVSDVMMRYEELLSVNLSKKNEKEMAIHTETNENPLKCEIYIEDINKQIIDSINTNDSFYIVAELETEHELDKINWGISLHSRDNSRILYLINTYYNIPFINIKKGKNRLSVLIKNLNLMPGVYNLNTGFMNISSEKPFYNTKPLLFKVNGEKKNTALFDVDTEWEVSYK